MSSARKKQQSHGAKQAELPCVAEHATVILDSIADGVFTVDTQFIVTSFNRAAAEITGTPCDEAVGRRCCDVFRASICEGACALRQTMQTGRPIVNKAIYIVDARGDRVPISISTALIKDERGRVIGGVETFRDLTLVEELRKELAGHEAFGGIVSKNYRIHRLFDVLPQVAASDSTVLIQGESGTGKELFARAVHQLSPRKRKPMVTVNCGALPDTLLESELFGYKAGAFTDAKRDKPGRFAAAEGGTIFLDEVGDVSLPLQVRLLRVLQEKTYEPLGSIHPVKADVRVVAATHRNLQELVDQGQFRSDLFYRINVVQLVIPPLRERKEDIPLLIDHIVHRFNRLRSKDIAGVSPEVLRVLMAHDYPGNVRELENIIEHAFVLCDSGVIEPAHLPASLRPAEPTPISAATTLREMESQLLIETLRRNDWNRLAAARELGIHKSTLFRKIKAHGLRLPRTDGRSARKKSSRSTT